MDSTLDRTGTEPSPIDSFRKFHVTKCKNGEGENWRNDKAKELYEKMENKKTAAVEENLEVSDWDIYGQVIVPSHGRILGLGDGLKAKDVFPSPTKNCHKRVCLERAESHEELKETLKGVQDQVCTLQEKLEHILNGQHSESARRSPMNNVESSENANIDRDE